MSSKTCEPSKHVTQFCFMIIGVVQRRINWLSYLIFIIFIAEALFPAPDCHVKKYMQEHKGCLVYFLLNGPVSVLLYISNLPTTVRFGKSVSQYIVHDLHRSSILYLYWSLWHSIASVEYE